MKFCIRIYLLYVQKVSVFGVILVPHFPTFGLNTDQGNSKYGHFSYSDTK